MLASFVGHRLFGHGSDTRDDIITARTHVLTRADTPVHPCVFCAQAMTPMFTVGLSRIMLGTTYSWQIYFSLVPIVMGT